MTDTLLSLDDLSSVFEKLFKARTKWFEIGMKLTVDIETLNSIKRENQVDSQKCLLEMLAHRLQAGGSLTGRDLCDCLRSPIVGRNDVAYQIEEWLMAGIQRITKVIMIHMSMQWQIQGRKHAWCPCSLFWTS